MDPLLVLILEDRAEDAELMVHQLRRSGYDPKWSRVDTERDFITHLDPAPEIILSDYQMPQFDGMRALEIVKERGVDIPFILVSGTIGEDLAVEAMQCGAADYLLKDRLARLGPAVTRVLAEKRGRTEKQHADEQLRQSDAQYRALVEQASDGIFITNAQGNYLDVNASGCAMLGYARAEILGMGYRNILQSKDLAENPPRLDELLAGKTILRERVYRRKNGTVFPVEISAKMLSDGRIQNIVRDITARKRSEIALRESEEHLRVGLNTVNIAVFNQDMDLRYTWMYQPQLGFTSEQVTGHTDAELLPPDAAKQVTEIKRRVLEGGLKERAEVPVTIGGQTFIYDLIAEPLRDAGGVIIGLTGATLDITERKRAEEQTVYQAYLLNNVNDAVIATDQNFVITSWNRASERIYGWKQAEVLGKTADKVLQPKFIDQPSVQVRQQLAQGSEYFGEVEQSRKDGARISVEGHSTALRDERGAITGYITVNRDITERKQSEHQVRESEVRFRAIFDQAPIAMTLLDAQGHPTISNLPLSKMVGYTNAELSKMKFADFTYPEDVDKDLNQFNALIEGKISAYSMEKRYVHKNGNLVWANLQVAMLRDENGLSQEIIGMAEDITERKRTEEQMQLSATLLNSVGQGVIATDTGGIVTYLNRAAENMYGWTADEAVGRNIYEVTVPQASQEQATEIMNQLAEGRSWSGEFSVQRRDGTVFPARVDDAPVLDSQGKLIGIIGVSSDITEHMRAEALQNAVYQIAQAAEFADSLTNLFQEIQRIISGVMPAENFYIALYDQARNRLSFPYSVDQVDKTYLGEEIEPGKGLTAYVLRTGKSLLCTDSFRQKLVEQGEVELIGVPMQVWLGVPLFIHSKIIGVMVVQDYSNPLAYGERELRVLEFVSSQVATAIERKQAQESLAASEAELRALFASMHDGVLVIDREGIYRKIAPTNPAAFQITPQELLGKKLQDIFPPEQAEMFYGSVQMVLDTKQNTQLEYQLDLNNQSRWYEATISPMNRDSTLWVTRDITERKRTENVIRNKVAVLQALAEIDREIISADNKQTILDLVCRHAAELLHIPKAAIATPDEKLGMILSASFGLVDPAAGIAEFTRLQRDGMFIEGETQSGVIAIDEIPVDNPFMPEFSHRENVHAMAMAHLTAHGKRVGTLSVFDTVPHLWNEDEKQILDLLASESAITLQKVSLLEETSRRANEFETLFGIARELAQEHELSRVLEQFATSAMTLLHAPSVTLSLFNASKAELETIVRINYPAELARTVKLGEGVSGHAAAARHYIIVDDYQSSEFRLPELTSPWIHAQLQLPMLYHGEILGVLSLHETGESTRKFTEADAELALLLAGQAAGVVHTSRLLEETNARVGELEALNRISTAMRVAESLQEMLHHFLDETLAVINGQSGVVWMYDPVSGLLRIGVERGKSPVEVLKPGESIVGHVFLTRQPYISKDFKIDPRVPAAIRERAAPGLGGAAIPILSGEHVVGVLMVRVQLPRVIQPSEIQLLTTFAELAGTAINRMRLFAQTTDQVQRLAALREIDRAISSSLDLTVTLNTFLKQATIQLGVDAADVLRLDDQSHILEFIAGIGFHSKALQHTHLRLGDGLAGKAALERKMIVVSDLPREINGLARSPSIQSEGFVTYYAVPLIAKGRVNGVLEIFHRARFDADENWLEFLNTLSSQAAIAMDNTELFQNLQHSNTELALAYDDTILGWSNALDLRDHETEGHTQRVTEVFMRLARRFGLSDAELVHLRRGALLHDIGKMGVPDAILLKPDQLNEDEWRIMRQHPEFAFRMLAPIAYLKPALDIPYCHHEKWDGTGYPRSLKGDQIPLAARIFAIADVWDALRSDRPYRKAWDEARTQAYLREQSGKHFDPRVVEEFLKLSEEKE